MTGTHVVTAVHLECVEEDHNKYYRTYVVAEKDGDGRGAILVRNWGRRSAPKGQWMRDISTGTGARLRARDLQEEKYYKSYETIHETEFEIPTSLAEALAASPRKDIDEALCLSVTSAFEAKWCEDICTIDDSTDSDDLLGWICGWKETLSARAPARALNERLGERVVHIDSSRDIAVARIKSAEVEAIREAFGDMRAVVSKETDGEEVAMIATRLWSPESSGPYRSLSNAVRDARRLFRRN